jgi:hypothetical protein
MPCLLKSEGAQFSEYLTGSSAHVLMSSAGGQGSVSEPPSVEKC